jgi:hypothetical protein
VNQPVFTILLAALGVLLLAWLFWPRKMHRIRGPAAELESRISHLMRSGPQTFLIVKIASTKDFLQLSATPESAEIDFPLITDRQRALEQRIREATAELGLACRETLSSDGSRFLDCDVTGTAADVARACRELLQRVFGVTEDATLAYETNANI